MRVLSLGDLLAGMARIARAAPLPMVVTDAAITVLALATLAAVVASPDPAGWLCVLMGASLAHALSAGWDLMCAALDEAAGEFGEAA
ncbi:hypothetical protein ACQEU5_25245 [Marinactinospora thermotolerans]|uniref:hypothetical protein n=1 Tax=Marinactinospora thermotolerans TaxID=531310 RepID=UPI003D90EA7D